MSGRSDADGAIVGARIRTLDEARPAASALAWRDGVMIAVGTTRRKPHVGPARMWSTGAAMAVVPGLIDSHIHPFWGTIQTRGVDLRSALTLDEVRARLAGERARCGPDQWVLGHSVGYEPFHDSGIRADAIAEAIGEGPALVSFFDGHTALASPAALELAGVAGAREFDESAEVVVDPDGRPTGALLETARWTSSGRRAALDGGRDARRVRRHVARAQRGRAHRRARDDRRPGPARRRPDARGTRRPHRRGC